jgi:hypothetical protein
MLPPDTELALEWSRRGGDNVFGELQIPAVVAQGKVAAISARLSYWIVVMQDGSLHLLGGGPLSDNMQPPRTIVPGTVKQVRGPPPFTLLTGAVVVGSWQILGNGVLEESSRLWVHYERFWKGCCFRPFGLVALHAYPLDLTPGCLNPCSQAAVCGQHALVLFVNGTVMTWGSDEFKVLTLPPAVATSGELLLAARLCGACRATLWRLCVIRT